MSQDKYPSHPQRSYGLNKQDITLLTLLIVFLIFGIILARLLVQCKRGNLNFLCTSSLVETNAEQLPQKVAEVATSTLTTEPTQMIAPLASLTPTIKKSTSVPTPLPSPTITPTEPIFVTPTATTTTPPTPTVPLITETPLPTPGSTLETPVPPPLPSPTATLTEPLLVISTATVIPSPTPIVLPVTETPTPPITPELLLYVQSHDQTHDLHLVTFTGTLVIASLQGYAAAPAWSPTGDKIAFFGEPGINLLGEAYRNGEGIWTSNAQGQNPQQILSTNHVKNLVWSPNDSKIAFEFGPPDATHEVVVIDTQGQEISRFSGEQPAWSPGGTKLVIKACLPNCGLWLTSLEGSAEQQLTYHETDSYPAWSTDDKILAFSSRRSGDWEVYLLDLASGNLTNLTNRAGTDTTPVFNRDNSEVYIRTDAFGSWWITVISLDGTEERKVVEGVGPSSDWGLARPTLH